MSPVVGCVHNFLDSILSACFNSPFLGGDAKSGPIMAKRNSDYLIAVVLFLYSVMSSPAEIITLF